MATSFKQPTSFWRKFRNWFVDPAPRSRRRHSRRPAFDALEDRTTPSATLLGSELLIGPINSTTNQWPSAAMDALGNSVAVWEYQGLAGRQFDSSGTALGPVTTLVPGVPFQPAVAADAAGNYVVAFFSFNDHQVHARRFDAAGVQQGADIVVGPPGTYDYITWPSVVQTPGGFAVFWDQDDAFIHCQQYDASGNLVDSINVPEPTHVIRPRVGADAAGNFVVVYGIQYADYLGGPLYGQRISAAGAAVGSPFSLTVTTGAASADPVVAVEGNGTFAASWLNYTGAASLAGLGYLDAAYGFTYVTAYSFVGGNDIAYMYNNPTYVYVAGFPVVVYRAR